MKYCTDVHGLLRKQEAGDLKLLWLLLFDPVGADQLTDSLLRWFHVWPFEGNAIPTRFSCDLIHLPSHLSALWHRSAQSLIPTYVKFLEQSLWSVKMLCRKLLLQLIMVLRTCRKKRNGLECVLHIYFFFWYVYGNFRCQNRYHEYKGKTYLHLKQI